MSCINLEDNDALVITQYETATNLKNIISGLNNIVQKYQFDILCEFENGLSIDNAFGWLLNRIGDNFGYPRPALPSGIYDYFGYDDNGTNYDQAPFYYGSTEPLVPASDIVYKTLLKAWIEGLFYDGSVLEANKALTFAFGKGYIIDHENLVADIVIWDQPYYLIYSIIKSGVIPKVAGVKYDRIIMRETNVNFFGFAGCEDVLGFDQAPFVRTVFNKDII